MSESPERIDRVLPDTAARGRSFDYRALPDGLAQIGSIVRVPLHGRNVRGWVVATDVVSQAPADRLLDVRANVSAGPPPDIVALTEFAAWRWAGQQSVFLRAASPPNNVALDIPVTEAHALYPEISPPVTVATAGPQLIIWPPSEPRADLLSALLSPEGSTLLIVPDPGEQDLLAQKFTDLGRNCSVVRSELSAADRTQSWAQARGGAQVIIGGRTAVFSPLPDLKTVIILDDADEALGQEGAPTWHARDLAIERAQRVSARLIIVSPAPTVEALIAAGDPVTVPSVIKNRGWPRFEIVDRREDPPGLGLLARALGPALHQALDANKRALCVLNRRGRARLLACRTCGELVRCPRCDSVMGEIETGFLCPRCTAEESHICRHCGTSKFRAIKPGVTRVRDDLAGLVPHHVVVALEAGETPRLAFDVAIGTETVLHRLTTTRESAVERPIGLIAFLDFDQELLAPRYRAVEQAMWLLVRAARAVGARADGGVVLVQTRIPDHEVLVAAATGTVEPLLISELSRRRDLSFPPLGGLAAVSGDLDAVTTACHLLGDQVTVMGEGAEVLLRAPTTDDLCRALAAVDLGPARAKGRLRIDVDPLRV